MVAPDNYLKDLKASTVDSYWQIYWGFAAAMMAKKPTDAVLCVDSAKAKYPDSINDITLAQAYLEVFQYVDTKDTAYLDDAENDLKSVVETESACLQEFIERLKVVLSVRTSIPSIEKVLISRPVAAPQATPAVHQTQTQKPSAPQQAKPATQPAAHKSVSQDSKGYTINSAGGPLNPNVYSNLSKRVKVVYGSRFCLWLLLWVHIFS